MHSCRSVAPGLKKIRMDDLGATIVGHNLVPKNGRKINIKGSQGTIFNSRYCRNSSYDNRATYAINVIFTSNYRSRLDCASQCTALGECKSVMFNMDTRQCQLLSVHMDDQSDAGPHTSVGWLYYERKTEDEPNTATETADLPTTVISTETSHHSIVEKTIKRPNFLTASSKL
uniref:Uncharacterized protein n=1 Tax=Magallana gigas TaxID=29159 RepID=K1P8F6_MAGGI